MEKVPKKKVLKIEIIKKKFTNNWNYNYKKYKICKKFNKSKIMKKYQKFQNVPKLQ